MDDYKTTPSIGNRLKYKRKEIGINQGQLSSVSGVSQRQISAYEREKSEPRADTLERLAVALGTTAEWLEFGDEQADIDMLTQEYMKDSFGPSLHVPILKWDIQSIRRVKFSIPQDYIPVPDVATDESFALVVPGNGMAPDYPEGSVIIVDPNAPAQSGSDVVVEIAGGVTFKRYSVEPGGNQFLVPVNPQFPAIPVKDEEFRVLGVVVLQLIYRHRNE
ncbi:S24 family peptidase [Vreelandella populi]|uniref:S24 family peptidase n=1 Tax=Vreelandella populi TaxID=2498858 RepID=UPI00163B890A|nr:S24 family peptidase [Halomonas populi]